jgi:hypothetical protein
MTRNVKIYIYFFKWKNVSLGMLENILQFEKVGPIETDRLFWGHPRSHEEALAKARTLIDATEKIPFDTVAEHLGAIPLRAVRYNLFGEIPFMFFEDEDGNVHPPTPVTPRQVGIHLKYYWSGIKRYEPNWTGTRVMLDLAKEHLRSKARDSYIQNIEEGVLPIERTSMPPWRGEIFEGYRSGDYEQDGSPIFYRFIPVLDTYYYVFKHAAQCKPDAIGKRPEDIVTSIRINIGVTRAFQQEMGAHNISWVCLRDSGQHYARMLGRKGVYVFDPEGKISIYPGTPGHLTQVHPETTLRKETIEEIAAAGEEPTLGRMIALSDTGLSTSHRFGYEDGFRALSRYVGAGIIHGLEFESEATPGELYQMSLYERATRLLEALKALTTATSRPTSDPWLPDDTATIQRTGAS